jgi:hypothetical protein
MTKIAGSRAGSESISQRHGSADPDPHQQVTEETDFSALLESQGRGERRGPFRKDIPLISEMS